MKKNDLSFPVRGALSLPRMVEGVMGCDTKESTLLGPTTAYIGGHTHFHVLTPWLVVVVPIFLLLVRTSSPSTVSEGGLTCSTTTSTGTPIMILADDGANLFGDDDDSLSLGSQLSF